MSVVGKCSNPSCGKGSETKLQACSRCHSVSYCSADCQKQHWKEHKLSCNQTSSKDVRKLLKKMNISDKDEVDKIRITSYTAFGTVAPGKPLPEGVPSNFHLKQHAQICAISDRKSNISLEKLGIYKYEKVYLDYYEDIVKNKEEWMAFFMHELNNGHTGGTCSILCILATIYRLRGGAVSFEKCEEVLDMERIILAIFKKSADALGDKYSIDRHDKLRYKYNLVRFLLYIDTDRLGRVPQVLRECLEYEVERNLDYEHQHIILPIMKYSANLEPTARNVKNLKDSQLKKMARDFAYVNRSEVNSEESKAIRNRVALVKCEACGKVENTIGEFKMCIRCESVHYCNRTCQKKHHKIHKKVCNKKK